MIQLVQLVPTSQSDQFFAWIVVEGIMLKIPITVPRVFYINSKAPLEEKFPGRRVNKVLPHGKHNYNLYEVLLVLMLLCNNFVRRRLVLKLPLLWCSNFLLLFSKILRLYFVSFAG